MIKTSMLRTCAAGVVGAVAALALVACSNQTVRDLEGVPVTDPDKSRMVVNIDKYANANAICIEGEGFITTTRDYDAIIHIPEWSATRGGWCAK